MMLLATATFFASAAPVSFLWFFVWRFASGLSGGVLMVLAATTVLAHVPPARRGFLTGSVLGFAHTIGEFGVVLMIGGNIPGETKVLSIAIYDYVETLQWTQAHILAVGMLAFAFTVILTMMLIEKRIGGPDQ